MAVSQTSLFLMTSTVLRSVGQASCWVPLSGNLCDYFFMIGLELWVTGRKIIEVKGRVHHLMSRGHLLHMIYDLGCCSLDYLAEVVLGRSPL